MKCKTCGKKLRADEALGIGECDACLNKAEQEGIPKQYAAMEAARTAAIVYEKQIEAKLDAICEVAIDDILSDFRLTFEPNENRREALRERIGQMLADIMIARTGLERKEAPGAVERNQAKASAIFGGLQAIGQERLRQLGEEGHSPEHDDAHKAGELALAAIHYARPEGAEIVRLTFEKNPPGSFMPQRQRFNEVWPWDLRDDKRGKHDRLKQLAIAGALIAAEIDRLLRLKAGEKP